MERSTILSSPPTSIPLSLLLSASFPIQFSHVFRNRIGQNKASRCTYVGRAHRIQISIRSWKLAPRQRLWGQLGGPPSWHQLRCSQWGVGWAFGATRKFDSTRAWRPYKHCKHKGVYLLERSVAHLIYCSVYCVRGWHSKSL